MSDVLEVFESPDGGWRWHRQAANGEILSSGEGFTRERDAWRAAYRANPDLEPEEP